MFVDFYVSNCRMRAPSLPWTPSPHERRSNLALALQSACAETPHDNVNTPPHKQKRATL
jgi:hypothetical protein